MSTTSILYYNGLYAYLETQIDMGASVEQAWEVFADFESWPRWTSGFMRFVEPPKSVGRRCSLVCTLSQGAMKSTSHKPMVRAATAQRNRCAGAAGDQAWLLACAEDTAHWRRGTHQCSAVPPGGGV